MADQTKIVKIDDDKFQVLVPKDSEDFNGQPIKVVDSEKSSVISREALKRDIVNGQAYLDDLRTKLTLIDQASPAPVDSDPIVEP